MIYGTKEKSEIINGILTALQKDANINAVQPGSIARAFADAIGSEIADLYSSLSFSLRQGALSTAVGRNLDLIGNLYNVPRKNISDAAAAERQSFNIEFYIQKPYSVDVIVPKDTIIYTDVNSFATRQYQFKLYGPVTISAGTTKAYGLVIPNFNDNNFVAAINSLTSHNAISPPGVILFCNNTKEVYSIVNSESDENYRRRIISGLKSKTSGTVESVRFATLAIKGVRDVRIRESSFGLGSCDIIIVPETSSGLKNMPQEIYDTIVSVKPVGVRFNIRIAEKLPINISATITLGPNLSENFALGIRNQASLFIQRYLNSLTIGDRVSVTEMQRQISSSSDHIKYVNINSFNTNGKEILEKDFTPSSDKLYITAGAVTVYSVIMGTTNY